MLNLFVPAQAPPSPDSFLLDPKQTEQWFAALPKANVGETARRIYNSLVDFNRMELAPVLRARNAEQFREPIDYICTNLRRHFVDTGFPLTEKGQKAAALARALYQELAISYKSIVNDLLAGTAERFDRKLLVISLHRAASYINAAMLHASLVYAPWPTGLWRELHGIYAYAWQNRIHPVQVRNGTHRSAGQSTLESVYITALLFATAEPQRLRQGQQLALTEALPGWSGLVRLGPPDEVAAGVGQFQVDLFSDAPPMRHAPDAPAANRRLRNLDLHALLKHMRKLFEATAWQGSAGSDTRGNTLSRQLLRTVLHSWGSSHERRFVRTRLSFELTVIAGLNGLHAHLMHLAQTEDRDGDTDDRYASSFIQQRDMTPIDPWSEPFRHGLSRPLRVEADRLSEGQFGEADFSSMLPDSQPSAAPNDGAARPGQTIRTVNESAGGYCIQWQGPALPRVRIGELLGIQRNVETKEFSLAAIRWLRQEAGKTLQFGVEILAPYCRAGEVAPSGEARQTYPRILQRCLIVPTSAGQDSDAIVLPSALYAVDTTLTLHDGDNRRPIRLSQVVETTGAYARYRYEDDSSHNPDDKGSSGESDFDDLWNNL